MLRVLHLVGSTQSVELDDLSRLYARGALGALEDPGRYVHVVAHVGPDGTWRFPGDLSETAIAAAEAFAPAAAIMAIAELDVDVMVPHLFCPAGMTHLRALFEVLDIPYIGNTPQAMAVAARKDMARAIVASAGVAVPEAELVWAGGTATLEPPVVVKPLDADNSAGLTLVRDRADYPVAIARALARSSAHAERRHSAGGALVERFIPPGREVRCGLLERAGELVALPLEEYPLDAETRPVRTAADKLARDERGTLALVAKGGDRAWIVAAEDPVNAAVQNAARHAHRALGCRHYSLFDFRVDAAGRPWFLEAGLYCSFSPQSVVVTMAAAADIATDELFALVVAEALAGTQRTVVGEAR